MGACTRLFRWPTIFPFHTKWFSASILRPKREPIGVNMSKEFFASLYENQPAGLTGNFDAAVTKLVTKMGSTTVVGDQALQALMMNYVTSSPQNAAKGQNIAAALGGIKMGAVNAFATAFPGVKLDTLIAEAKKAGHHVEVIGGM